MVRISVRIDKSDTHSKQEKIEIDAKAFIFDKDGTLLTHDHFVPIMEKRVELLTEHYKLASEDQKQLIQILGLDAETHEIIPYGTMFIARADTQLLVEVFLAERGFRSNKEKQSVAQLFREADAQVELDKYIKPLPGIPELLGNLKTHGAHIAITTHDSTEAAKRQLAIANIEQYLDLIIGLDYNENILHKPSPSMFLTACEKFNIKPKDAVVLGDSVNDVLMGKHGGAGLVLAVLSGEHKTEDFKDHDAIIDSVAALKILD